MDWLGLVRGPPSVSAALASYLLIIIIFIPSQLRKRFYPFKTVIELGADYNTQIGVWQFKSSWEDRIIGGRLTVKGRCVSHKPCTETRRPNSLEPCSKPCLTDRDAALTTTLMGLHAHTHALTCLHPPIRPSLPTASCSSPRRGW